MSTLPHPPQPAPSASPLSASLAGFGDLFSRELRGLLALSMLVAAVLLATGIWAVVTFAVPLVPDWAGWWGALAEGVASGAAVLVALALALALWPLVAMVVSGLFFDVAANRLEARLLPEAARGTPPSLDRGLGAGLRFAAVSLPLNLLALPLYFIPVVNLVVAALLNVFLLSRENFMMAALRYGPFRQAEQELRVHRLATLLAALAPALLSLIPFFNFVVPMWTLATMVRLRASGQKLSA
jgi:CysZ protein